MDIKQYKNEFGHMVVKCPFCEEVSYVREVSLFSPDALRTLKAHITNIAKKEAFLKALDLLGDDPLTPHFDYYKEHTADKKVVLLPQKRQFDADLQLKEK